MSSPEERTRKIVVVTRDASLLELVTALVEAPWNVEIRLDGRSVRDGLVSGVRAVIVDDALLVDSERGWLLDQIHAKVPEAAVVYVASSHSTDLERDVRGHGVLHYTSKPVDREHLSRVLAAVFAKESARKASKTPSIRTRRRSWESSTSKPD